MSTIMSEDTMEKKRPVSAENTPRTLLDWKVRRDARDTWDLFRDVLQASGITLWPHHPDFLGISPLQLKVPESFMPNGYAYVTPDRRVDRKDGYEKDGPGSARELIWFESTNESKRAARLRDGRDGIVRVVALRDEGRVHLKILRKVATEPLALLTNNHALPMLAEITSDPVTFCVFPIVGGGNIRRAYDEWPKSSVGDILDMLTQALEALVFIHDLNIAHRDAFPDNFLVQWQPESLYTMKVPTTRPRVFLIDFETAVLFEPDSDPSYRTCLGIPTGVQETYSRPLTQEMKSGQPYDPFKLDVWQLSICLTFDTNISEVDEILQSMRIRDALGRPASNDVLAQLQSAVNSMSPQSLLIPLVPLHTEGH
ncbi:hypothetical protein EVG20_g1272 [Dentipellis fragilis]|uniref:Protein kinase domain-containing protein n=1 Tax=Dentipellis fragilis TaxID=205917 RepID=A0A4Y9ZD86_9AGAM|nr:hypothetical protein EVG20_g1272 [Dentipellis fragilis]